MSHILIVEDESEIAGYLRRGLAFEGFSVEIASTGTAALTAARERPPDLVVLDIMLPGVDGLEVARRLRGASEVPIIMLTARDAVPDRVAGLEAGADDYLVKPFDLGELQARLRALLRRGKNQAEPVLERGALRLDPAARSVSWAGRPVELSAREYAVLHALLLNVGRVLSKAQLEEKLYGWGEEIESNAVEVFVHHLRRKLAPELIRTVRGVGYMIPKEPA